MPCGRPWYEISAPSVLGDLGIPDLGFGHAAEGCTYVLVVRKAQHEYRYKAPCSYLGVRTYSNDIPSGHRALVTAVLSHLSVNFTIK